MTTVILPYRTDWREMSELLEYAKGKGADRSALDARFGGGEGLRETLNALDQLSLIERDESGSVRLNQLGNQVAYATDDESKISAVVQVILGYLPYRVPLERAVADGRDVLEGPWLENIWQVDMNLNQPRNRVEEARTFFFRLLDDATGLGTYRRGVRGQVTRFEFATESLQIFGDYFGIDTVDKDVRQQHVPEQLISEVGYSRSEPAGNLQSSVGDTVDRPSELQLCASVDMTDWDLEKIEGFLRLVGFPINEKLG